MEEALLRSHARFRLLADANLFGVVIANANGNILEANDYYLEILGNSRADLAAGRVSWKNMTPPEWLEADYRNLADLAAYGVSPPYEKEYVRSDGSRRSIYLANAMLPDDDGRILAVVIDITGHKREEEQLRLAKQVAQQANEAKSRFLATVSHDLKQPIAALGVYASLLPAILPPRDAGLSMKILHCVTSMRDFLGELLELSMLQVSGVQVAVKEFDVIEFLDQVALSQMPEATHKKLSLHYRSPPLIARTDPVLLRMLLSNLLSNAIRYTNTGGVLIGCRRYQGKYWVEVWDTGIGIPVAQINAIFGAFQQDDNGQKRSKQGNGLGLAIVEQIAHLLGLALRVRSREGQGSMFAFELPLAGATSKSSNGVVAPSRTAI